MTILMNPGPVTLSKRVRSALGKPDLCHREKEFSDLQTSIRSKLLAVYNLDDTWAAVLLTGSGTSAMEAMMSSMVSKDENVLIIENGVYGERLRNICQIYAIKNCSYDAGWGNRIDPDRLRSHLNQDIGYIAVVHHETTTGRLNDLDEIAKVAREFSVPLLVDAVSSFGAEEIQFKAWNIAACAGTANKCLHGVPGMSFVILNRNLATSLAVNRRSLYLDLGNYLSQQDTGGTPFTQSVQVMYALDEALNEHIDQGGWQARQETYRAKMDLLRRGLTDLGIRPLIESARDSSCVLQSYHLPAGVSYQRLHDELKEHGFVIYAGQGELAKSIFRVSLMGEIDEQDVKRFLECVAKITG